MIQVRTTILIPCLAAALGAQNAPVVVPSSAVKAPGNTHNQWMFYGATSTNQINECRVQYMYATSDITPITATFKSMQTRRHAAFTQSNFALKIDFDLSISTSTIAPSSATATFSNNVTRTPSKVFSSSLSLPLRRQGTWPEPWEAAVPFSSPFQYLGVGSKSLVLDCVTANNSLGLKWYVEGHQPLNGEHRTEMAACSKHSENGKNNGVGYDLPKIGGNWWANYTGLPMNTPSFAASFQILGTQGAGGTQFGLTLPILLSKFNLASNNCSLAVNWLASIPLTYLTSTTRNQGSARTPTILIPNNPVLSNFVFYTQPVFTDTNKAKNTPELYMGWASKWTIGNGSGAPASQIYSQGNKTALIGILRKGEVATIRLNQ